jgi:FkbM family methyltransferase
MDRAAEIGVSDADIEAAGCLEYQGIRFPDLHRVISGRVRRSLRGGDYESGEAEVIRKNVKPGETVMELGGGIGFISTLVATQCGARAVHTFEANAGLIPYIEAVHRVNGSAGVEVNHAILGPRAGTAPFYVRKDILSSSMAEVADKPPIRTETVEIRDAVAEFDRIRPDVLICDIEGAEADLMPVLPLTGLRAAILELHPQWIGPQGINRVFRAFMDGGMAYYPRYSNRKVVCFRRNWHVT